MSLAWQERQYWRRVRRFERSPRVWQPNDENMGREPIADIFKRVAAKNGVALAVLRGRSRTVLVNAIRREAVIAATEAGFSSTEIGRYCDRDHSTILWILGSLTKCEQQ